MGVLHQLFWFFHLPMTYVNHCLYDVDITRLLAFQFTIFNGPYAVVDVNLFVELAVDDWFLSLNLHQQRVNVVVNYKHLLVDILTDWNVHLKLLEGLSPNILVGLSTITFRGWFILILLLLTLRILCFGCDRLFLSDGLLCIRLIL